MQRLGRRLWGSAWLLLPLTALFWAGNVVVGRAIVGPVPPVALAFWRWTGAFCFVILFAWPHLRRDLPILTRRWRMLVMLSATGIAAFNTMSYHGLQTTTALNALLLQSAMPLVVLVWAFALFAERPTLRQTLGVVVSLVGVAVIAAHGQIAELLRLSLNEGDVWVLAALVIYALYSVLLRRRPPVHPLSFLAASFAVGSLMLLPLYVWEMASGSFISGGAPSLVGMLYTAIFPSFLAYLCFNRGVELIGAGHAGQSVHLMPVFGSLLAVVFLGEAFRSYHMFGIALIAAGILLASIRASSPDRARPTVPT